MKGTLNELVGGFSPRLEMHVFRSHTVLLQDGAMRDRINCLIDSISGQSCGRTASSIVREHSS